MSKLEKYSKEQIASACEKIEDQLLDGIVDLYENELEDRPALLILWEAYKQFKPQLKLEGADK